MKTSDYDSGKHQYEENKAQANLNTEAENDKMFNGSVNTKIACLVCREKKLKCDKLLPACTRCTKKGHVCIYVEHKKTGPKPNSNNFRVKKSIATDKHNERMSSNTNNDDNDDDDNNDDDNDNDNDTDNDNYNDDYDDNNNDDMMKEIPEKIENTENESNIINTPRHKLDDDNINDHSILKRIKPDNVRYSYQSPSQFLSLPSNNQYQSRSFYEQQQQNQIPNSQLQRQYEPPSKHYQIDKNSPLAEFANNDTNNIMKNHNNLNTRRMIPLESFMNPLPTPTNFFSQPLVQNSTTNLRSESIFNKTSDSNNTHSSNISTSQAHNNSLLRSTVNINNKETPSTSFDASNIEGKLYEKLDTTTDDARANKDSNSAFNILNQKHSITTQRNSNRSIGFNTSLTSVTNKSFDDLIGLSKLGLTISDIDKFHAFYFNSNTRIFKYSTQRYYNTFVKEPKKILHYSYMIWTIACFNLDQYEWMVDTMYQAALIQMNEYWESNRDSFHSDILTYLHALCLKSQFEFLSGREMRAALTVSSSIRLTQMYGYDQIDLSPTTLGTPAIFFRSFSLSSEQFEPSNALLGDDELDPDIPLVEERRRVLWEVYAIDKWSSLVTGLPCALSVDSLSVIFTKLPSPTTFLPLNNDNDITGNENGNDSENENDQSSFYIHEAMQKLDNNQVLLDINSSSSKILLLTISENIIKWCKMFLTMVELETLKSPSSIDSIRNKVDELVRNFESMHNNLLFFDLTTEPLMNIVITNTSTLLYQTVLIKFDSLFNLQFKEDPTGSNICENEIKLFKDILYEVSNMSEKLILRFIKKSHIENHLKKAPVFIVFINSIKSLFQCIAFVLRYNNILKIDEQRKLSLIETLRSTSTIINSMPGKTPIVAKTKTIINNGQELLDHSPQLLSFFDSFFDSAKTY